MTFEDWQDSGQPEAWECAELALGHALTISKLLGF